MTSLRHPLTHRASRLLGGSLPPSCAPRVTCLGRPTESKEAFVKHTALHLGMEVLYDALAPHVTLVIVVESNREDQRKSDFVGEVSPFFPLCIDEGSSCSMPNHERGTVAITRQAPRTTDGQALREQFKHLQVQGCAISVGTRPLNGEATTALMPCILLCRSSAGSPQLTTNPLRQGEEGKNDALHFFPCHFLHIVAERSPCPTEERKRREEERRCGQNSKSGGSDPAFSAFSRPKSSWGRSRPTRWSRALGLPRRDAANNL